MVDHGRPCVTFFSERTTAAVFSTVVDRVGTAPTRPVLATSFVVSPDSPIYGPTDLLFNDAIRNTGTRLLGNTELRINHMQI